MSKRLEGGYLTARPTWSTAATPGVWTPEQQFARAYASGWPAVTPAFDPYFESVSLLLHMDGSNGSTTFVDSSLGNLAVTANGNAQISTAQSKFGGSSGLFDGTGDNLNIATPSSFLIDWAGGDFTLEYWIRCTAFPAASGSGSAPIVIGNMSNSADTNYWSFGPIGDGKVRFYYYNGGPVSFTTTSSLSLNTWHHLAFVKSGTGMTIYIDGISSATATVSGTPQFLSATGLSIGQYTNTSFNGYLDEIRLTKGVARYTANFNVPSTPGSDEGAALYDPYFDYVSLLLRCNGDNNSTTFTDSSNNATTITRGGNAVISTAVSRFGGSSVYFNGTDDSVSFPDPALGTSDFTIEMWINTSSSVQYAQLIGNESSGGATGYTLLINNNSSTGGQIALYVAGSLTVYTSSGDWSDGNWHHVALTRSGTTFRLYIDVTQLGSATSSASMSSATGTTVIGRNPTFPPRNLVGYLDDIRVTKGVCRYTTDFRPVGPYAASGKLVDPYLTSTSLLLPMSGDDGTTSFFDRSNNFLRATEYGNAKVSTTQSMFGGTSAYFDGTGDFLSYASSTLFGFGTNDFTIEYWWYPTRNSGNETLIDTRPSDTATPLVLGKDGSGAVRCYDGTTIRTGGTMALNAWNHVAWSRAGTNNQIFLNGVSVIDFSNGFDAGSSRGLTIGSNVLTSAENCQGYVDDIRITKGAARYTSTFVPPALAFNDEAFNDPHYNAVSLLLHMDGTNNSTTFTDSSVNGLTVTANGDAKISTTQSRFGGASAYFDGNGDNLSIADNETLEIGGSDFSLECWIYVTTLKGYQAIVSKSHAAADQNGWCLIFETNNAIAFYAGNGAWAIAMNGGAIISTNTWYHVAVTRSGNIWRMFVNGIQVATTTVAITLSNGTLPFYIGHYPYFPGANSTQDFSGYIDEFRFTKGIARYTSNFTPPTLPFYNTTIPTVDSSFSSVSLLLHMNGSNGSTTFTDSSLNALTVTANGNAQISTAQSKFGGASAYFDGSGDWLTVNSTTVASLGTSDFTIEAWIYKSSTTNIYATIVGNNTATYQSGSACLLVYSSGIITFVSNPTNPCVASTTAINLNTWYHVAVTRTGNSFSLFLNGILDGSGTASDSINLSSGNLLVGRNGWDVPQSYWDGYIDDLRITKGVARYTSNFYIPRAAFPDA